MGNRRMGLGRMEALLEQIDRDLNLTNSILTSPTITDAAALTVAGTTGLAGALTRLTPAIAFQWNYLTCASPVFSTMGNATDGVLADGDQISAIFPGPNGEMFPATGCSVGAFTVTGVPPQIVGALATPDANGVSAGLDIQMDAQTAANVGLQLIPGAGPLGGATALTVGTHSGYIDVTFATPDWTDFDGVVIGWRKIEDFQTAMNAAAAAGTANDLIYEDIVAFGVQTDTDLRIATDINGTGTSTVTNCGASVPVDDDNLRLRVTVSSAGVVTYSFVVNQVAGAGTLAAPATTAAFTFNDGEIIVPYIASICTNAAEDILVIKDIEVQVTPGKSYLN